jgi:cobalt-zinc-cadmium efflux system protein
LADTDEHAASLARARAPSCEHAHAPHAHAHGHADVHAPSAHGVDERDARDRDEGPLLAPRALDGTFTAGEARQARRLFIVLVTIAVFFVGELGGAIAARSEVLKVDALHLLMDVFALAMSLLAMRLAVRRPTARFTFGMRRAEPVAALFNAGLVIVATVGIVREAIGELGAGSEAPNAGIMFYVAAAALVVNGLSAWLLHGAIHHDHGHEDHHGAADHGPDADHAHAGAKHAHGHAMNLRGVWLHLIGDMLGSLAALVAAVVIRMGGSPAVDPVASFIVAAILLAGAFRLIRDATLVLLEAAPPHLPVGAVRDVVAAFPGVAEVHDLHVWSLGAGHDAITVHVRARDGGTLARRLSDRLRRSFHVEYVTVQVETPDEDCDAPSSPCEGGL